MTTLAVDDELYRLAQAAATAEGTSVDAFVSKVLREALSSARLRQTVRNGLPVMVCDGPFQTIEPDKVRRVLEEEGF